MYTKPDSDFPDVKPLRFSAAKLAGTWIVFRVVRRCGERGKVYSCVIVVLFIVLVIVLVIVILQINLGLRRIFQQRQTEVSFYAFGNLT
jgi:hypothetical protein